MKRFYILFIFSLTAFIVNGQHVIVKEDPAVKQVMVRYEQYNKSLDKLSGYRIQILATQDKRKMEKEEVIFRNRFPQMRTKWLWENPYYKIQVGAFASRLEAERALYSIKYKYESAYTVRVKNISSFELL